MSDFKISNYPLYESFKRTVAETAQHCGSCEVTRMAFDYASRHKFLAEVHPIELFADAEYHLRTGKRLLGQTFKDADDFFKFLGSEIGCAVSNDLPRHLVRFTKLAAQQTREGQRVSLDVEQTAASIRAGAGIEGNVMEIIPSCLRAAFAAPPPSQFICADLSQIELRVLAWLTSCAQMLEAFAAERDLYVEFAAQMYRTPYDQVTKLQRQIAKPAVLSCGYGTGGGELREDKKGDSYKSGLWGYAESMGVSMTQAEAHDAVYLYRSIYPQIQAYWNAINDVVETLLDNDVRTAVTFGFVAIGLIPDKLLVVTLPSGRRLHYLRPAWLDGITFEGLIVGKTWGRRRLYGSLLTENIVQAIARDILAVGMARAHDAGFVVVSHTHDELLCQHDALDKRHSLTYLKDVMTAPVSWAPGLMIKAEGWEGDIYRK